MAAGLFYRLAIDRRISGGVVRRDFRNYRSGDRSQAATGNK